MARWQYRCESCENTVPAERIEKRVPGSSAQVRLMVPVFCESGQHPAPQEMVRETYTPKRREVRDD